ncbi:hypothetical protein QVD17_26639 [Tagetes erecta]|uniref:Diacylglycerol O-acyltransferase n=1 Tax=Tagetes erecta TaxID=13708 RepID=A0AAD8NIR6_TARER|nr:hypothetical protein QVD17_26639 [Tagetes erecta]
MSTQSNEPLTPAGRLFVQPATEQIINCALGIDRPVDIETVRSVVSDSLLVKLPRFTSILVTDKHGIEQWKRVELELDRHIILVHDVDNSNNNNNDEDVVNDYLANLTVSCPLSNNKPLWEIHVLPAHKCVVMRFHHALGDGVSLLSLMLTLCRKVSDGEKMVMIEPVASGARKCREGVGLRLWKMLKMLWFTVIYMVEFCMRCLWLRDKEMLISGGEGVEMWPRKLVTAKFSLDDMKTVKRAVVNATINDVLFGVISYGLSRYLENHSTKPLREGLQITGAAMVNLRKSSGLQEITELMKKNSGSRWGNKFGMMLLPIFYHGTSGSDPLQFLKRAKVMIDNKKLSLEAFLSYKLSYFVMKYFGPKFTSLLNYRIVCNTTFTISNLVGPKEEFMIAGVPVTYIRATGSSLAHAITMHMVSYAGKAEMQILVAEDIIPHPEILAKCFQDALLEMKQAALAATLPQK